MAQITLLILTVTILATQAEITGDFNELGRLLGMVREKRQGGCCSCDTTISTRKVEHFRGAGAGGMGMAQSMPMPRCCPCVSETKVITKIGPRGMTRITETERNVPLSSSNRFDEFYMRRNRPFERFGGK